LWQYWVHRLPHAWPVFWQTHNSTTAIPLSVRGRSQTSLIELCTAHRLVFAFIADLGLVDAALRRNLCDVQDYPPTGIPAADFSGHLGEATIARLLGFIG